MYWITYFFNVKNIINSEDVGDAKTGISQLPEYRFYYVIKTQLIIGKWVDRLFLFVKSTKDAQLRHVKLKDMCTFLQEGLKSKKESD